MTEIDARAIDPRAAHTNDDGRAPLIRLPDLCLVALVGVSGCGKSTFARKHFLPTEVLSSDGFRALVSDSETDQTATTDAFDALYFIARRRLARGRLTVVDATNVQPEARKQLLRVAKEHDVFAVAIVLDVPERVCAERNRTRADRQVPPHVIPQQHAQLRRSLRDLRREGFRHVWMLGGVDEVENATLVREPLWCDRRADAGPFDLIGDVHGAATSSTRCSMRWGTTPARTVCAGTPRAAAPYSSATWWTAVRAWRTC